jgi:hypothetical protein
MLRGCAWLCVAGVCAHAHQLVCVHICERKKKEWHSRRREVGYVCKMLQLGNGTVSKQHQPYSSC